MMLCFFWQIKSLEMEKASIQNSLDDVLELATKQNLSFNEKCDEVKSAMLCSSLTH